MKIKITSPTGTIYENDIERAKFPGELGQFEVLKGHAPLISVLVKGDIICFDTGKEPKNFAIENGFVEIKNDTITACVE